MSTVNDARNRPVFVFELPVATRLHRITARQDSESRMAGGLPRALASFANGANMLGTPLAVYAKNVVSEVVAVGRADSLLDSVHGRAYVSMYSTEQILNWRVERVNGRIIPTLVVLRETVIADDPEDSFAIKAQEQIRVFRLIVTASGNSQCIVELWRARGAGRQVGKRGKPSIFTQKLLFPFR